MSKKLTAYFSVSGKTAALAKKLAEAAGADLYEIRPAVPYTSADLNWQDKQSRTSVEMSDHSSRPALADKNADIAAYDTIYVGFPVWWYIAPTIINTFLESYDFSGKKIIPFCTSGGSGVGRSDTALHKDVSSDVKWEKGVQINRPNEKEIRKWLDKVL